MSQHQTVHEAALDWRVGICTVSSYLSGFSAGFFVKLQEGLIRNDSSDTSFSAGFFVKLQEGLIFESRSSIREFQPASSSNFKHLDLIIWTGHSSPQAL
jgi:hypothetical protein